MSGGTFTLDGGKLTGSGIINASVVNSARVSPGVSAGTLTINGDCSQAAAGGLEVELGGVAPGSGYDQLIVNGQASLAGALEVGLLHGFTPALGETFAVLTSIPLRGAFSAVTLPALPHPLRLASRESAGGVTLTVTEKSEPPAKTLAFVAADSELLEWRFIGETGRTYRLQASVDLVEWVDLLNRSASDGVIDYADPSWRSRDRRFYRMVTP